MKILSFNGYCVVMSLWVFKCEVCEGYEYVIVEDGTELIAGPSHPVM